MLSALGLCIAGLAVLVLGAELVVRGGTQVAVRFGISPVIIGLTIVAVGTSAPELAVGIDSVLTGNGDLAIGNIAGTNIVNILLILGLSALMKPLTLRAETLWLDLPMIVAASLALLVMAMDGQLTRIDGAILVGTSLAYTAAIVHIAQRENSAVKISMAKAHHDAAHQPHNRSLLSSAFALMAGILVIVAGAEWLVEGAVDLARIWGVSEAFIGLTIVAIGTSSPELATTVIATLKGQRDIAVGNLLGSSVYNILFILGVTCIVPSEPVPVARSLITIDLPVMLAVALLCIPVFHSGRQVSRVEGGCFIGVYATYLGYLVIARI